MGKLKLKLAKIALKYLKREILSLLQDYIRSLVFNEVLNLKLDKIGNLEAKVITDLVKADIVHEKIKDLSPVVEEKVEELESVKKEITVSINKLMDDYMGVSKNISMFKKGF